MVNSDLVQITSKSKPSSALRIVGVLSLIATICGCCIAVAVQLTYQPILKNQRFALEQAIKVVIPDLISFEVFELGQDGVLKKGSPKSKAEKFFAAYNASDELLGVAFMGAGAGYADKIQILFAYNPSDETLLGIKVTESKETPGLGAKIVDDAEFLKNFEQMPLKNDESGSFHPIQVVKGQPQEPWEIKAIAGATISSRAVAKILTQSGHEALPIIKKNINFLKSKGAY